MVWQRRFWRFNAPLSEESHRVFAEHLLNNKLQMSAFGATEGLVTQTKQMKIGLCEQVGVNWKTGVYATNASIIVTSEIGNETPGAAVLRQNSIRTENGAIPCRDRCPIRVIPSSPERQDSLPGEPPRGAPGIYKG
jgi:hypothetical protein